MKATDRRGQFVGSSEYQFLTSEEFLALSPHEQAGYLRRATRELQQRSQQLKELRHQFARRQRAERLHLVPASLNVTTDEQPVA